MDPVLDLLSWTALLAGAALVVTGGIGLLRLPDFFTRMHGSSLIDTLGAGLILLGLSFQAGPGQVAIKLAMILFFLLFTSPAATHALARAALHGGERPQLADQTGNGGWKR